jgi:hypothetical protein
MDFQFVDNSAAIDNRSRRLIRSHVMRGRNRGRTLPSRARKDAIPATALLPGTTTPLLPAADDGECGSEREPFAEVEDGKPIFPEMTRTNDTQGSSLSAGPLVGTEYSYFPFPMPLTPRIRSLVHQCTVTRPLQSVR